MLQRVFPVLMNRAALARFAMPCSSFATRRTLAKIAKPPSEQGAIVEGLNYVDGSEPVTIKANEEYPEWLWALAEDPKPASAFPETERPHWKKVQKEGIRTRNSLEAQG